MFPFVRNDYHYFAPDLLLTFFNLSEDSICNVIIYKILEDPTRETTESLKKPNKIYFRN